MGGDFLSLPVILLFLLLLPLLLIAGRQAANACAQNHPTFFRHPLLAISLCLCLSASNITPPLYATANIDAGRIRALMWEQFVLLLVLCLFYLAGWITSIRHLFGVTSDAHPDSFSSPEDDRTPVLRRAEYKKSPCTRTAFFCKLFYGIVLLLFLLRSAYLLQVNPRYYMSTSAITDLSNGNMRHYRAECGKREKIFHDASVKKVSLSPLHTKPELLFFQDFSTEPGGCRILPKRKCRNCSGNQEILTCPAFIGETRKFDIPIFKRENQTILICPIFKGENNEME